jgi:G patch domain and KOW motifs-containing protein
MGWTEKEGIGLTNKRTSALVEPELRPKGLGLGAGPSKKHRFEADDPKASEESLKFVKGAYLQILNGKHTDEYGQLIGFDDGMNRILVKLTDSHNTISVLQHSARLIHKKEYLKMTEYKR